MAIVGLLPASGKATRLAGVPKFALPYNDTKTLLQYHVEQLLEVCDEVRVCTSPLWAAFVEALELPVTLFVKRPSTMSDAVCSMLMDPGNATTVLIGMPDTVFLGSGNPYEQLLETDGPVVVATFDCPKPLRGHVGQVWRVGNTLLAAEDKNPTCLYPEMWGAMLLRGEMIWDLDPALAHPGLQLPRWIKTDAARAVKCAGQYLDLGRIDGLATFYTSVMHNGY